MKISTDFLTEVEERETIFLMLNRVAQYGWSDEPDPDDLKLPKTLDAIVQIAEKAQKQTDQSRAPEIDDHARMLIRKCAWDLLPGESAEYIEGLGFRFQNWNKALLNALIERRIIENEGGSVPLELL